jgi:uncharacterized membrane protein
MHKLIQRIQQLCAELKLEQLYNIFIILIISIILGLSTFASYRSISAEQLRSIYKIAHQSSYAQTQKMATELLSQEQVNVGQYLRLMMALQMEQRKVNEFPPMSGEEN